jgi:hypothetical protein
MAVYCIRIVLVRAPIYGLFLWREQESKWGRGLGLGPCGSIGLVWCDCIIVVYLCMY